MTRARVLAIALVVAVVVGVIGGVLFLLHGRSQAGRVAHSARVTAPPGALAAVRLLFAADGRKALTPELSSALSPGVKRLFPAGSRFSPAMRSWQQSGVYANVTGIVREPGMAPVRAEIGLVSRRGRWLVTFEGAL